MSYLSPISGIHRFSRQSTPEIDIILDAIFNAWCVCVCIYLYLYKYITCMYDRLIACAVVRRRIFASPKTKVEARSPEDSLSLSRSLDTLHATTLPQKVTGLRVGVSMTRWF